MVNQLLVGVITWAHIVSVVGWFGAVLTFLISIRSSLPKLSPQAGAEFILKVFPRFVRSVQVFTVLTVVFGPLLAFTMSDGPPNAFDLMSPWSIFITIGASLGIIMFFVVFLLFTPTANKLVRLIWQMQQNPQQPPPSELSRLQKRLSLLPPIGATLLLMAEAFMVAAAQF
jgi:uncharacterized membrane protein